MNAIDGTGEIVIEPDWSRFLKFAADKEAAHEHWRRLTTEMRERDILSPSNAHALLRLVMAYIVYDRAAADAGKMGGVARPKRGSAKAIARVLEIASKVINPLGAAGAAVTRMINGAPAEERVQDADAEYKSARDRRDYLRSNGVASPNAIAVAQHELVTAQQKLQAAVADFNKEQADGPKIGSAQPGVSNKPLINPELTKAQAELAQLEKSKAGASGDALKAYNEEITSKQRQIAFIKQGATAEMASSLTAGVLFGFHQDVIIGPVGSPIVDLAGQAGSTLNLRGVTHNFRFREGWFFSIIHAGRRYLHCVADSMPAGNDGKVALPIWPMLRISPADADVCEFAKPMIEGWLSGNSVEWSYDPDPFLNLSPFTITEAA